MLDRRHQLFAIGALAWDVLPGGVAVGSGCVRITSANTVDLLSTEPIPDYWTSHSILCLTVHTD